MTQTEQAAWSGLHKTTLRGNAPHDPEVELNDFYFYVMLPLPRLVNLLTKRKLAAAGFPFCEGSPTNFSFNPRSALAFHLFSQGHADYPRETSKADRVSTPWLLCFKLKVETLLNNFQTGNFGLWKIDATVTGLPLVGNLYCIKMSTAL